ncbi:MAG: hypothetical protein A2Y25_10205 [Candidatus Melainabacteria bacterium GWF2_37_15]|nr:MAG: hypothetical protein A2Y25_10205 [Candidatus Melainabacteria bacterium GWF2_37_15]
MQISAKNIFKLLIKEIFNLPVWIKQIIYIELKEEFDASPMKTYLNFVNKDTCLQLYVPKLTYAGKKELEKKSGKYSEETYNILEGAFQEHSIIETAIANNWSLFGCSKHFVNAINCELIVAPISPVIKGTALYMAGQIRLGEYFVKINKINIEQLDEALRTQKYMEDSIGDKPGLADVLVQLGFLTKEDTEGILLLKKDCLKYYESGILNETTVVGKS